ncbi:hypothetical protein JW851_04355, partial [Candidatus Woesearchaeota archaeon]|nr:hypothetical protein [Candidatus Woesearchaeota archaeon]
MVKNKNSKNYHVFLILLVLAILFSFGYMYFAFVQNPTGLTTYNESNQTNFPPEWIYNSTEFYTAQNAELIIDLNQYFFDENQDVLSYLATQPSSFSVSLEESVLTIKPDQNFVGERILTITASDNMNIVTQDIRIIVEETSSSFNQGDTIQDKDSKFVGKKVHDELDFETYFNYIIKNETGLFLSFYHDSVSPQSIWIDGEVGYELSSNLSSAYENVTLVVYRINQVIPKFKLHIGATSEVFEFGKEIPEVSIEDNEGNPANISFIDRDDEKLDIEVTKANAKAVIKGANTSQIQAKIDSINDSEIKTDVFAADSIDMEEAVISLPVQESINTIMECSDFNLTEFICQGEWIKTDIPFEKNESHITFTVSHFSGYGGANIEVLTVQSYPMVGSIWTVAFNTTG